MLIDKKSLIEWAAGDEGVIKRAENLFKKGYVSAFRSSEDSDRIELRGKVQSSGYGKYVVRVKLSREGDLVGYNCECPAFYQYEGICKHCAALILFAEPYLDSIGESLPQAYRYRPSSSTVRSLAHSVISDYSAIAPSEGENSGLINIEPHFHMEDTYGHPAISLSVGNKRMYVVRSVTDFLDAVVQRRQVAYGVQLEFTHAPEAFDALGRQLVETLLSRREECAAYQNYSNNSIYADKKQYLLTSGVLEELFDIYSGAVVDIDGMSSKILSDDRPLFLTVSGMKNGDAALSLPKGMLIARTASRIYLRFDEGVRQCGAEMSRALSRLIEGVYQTQNHFVVSKSDLPDFCADVLPVISPYVKISDMKALEGYTPEEMTPRLYADMPGDDEILLRPVAVYGEDETNPFQESTASGHMRDRRAERGFLRRLTTRLGAPESGAYVVRGDERISEMIYGGLDDLQKICDVRVSDRLRGMSYAPVRRPSVGVSLESDLLSIDIDIGSFPREELAAAMRAYREKRRYYRLKSGAFLDMDKSALGDLARLAEGMQLATGQLAGGKVKLPAFRAMYLDGLLKGEGRLGVKRDSSFRRFASRISTAQDADYAVPDAFVGELRMYQESGYRWLRTLSDCGLCGILADDMGLGKTIEFIALLLADETEMPSLIVCPASLALNWESELRKFSPSLDVTVISGAAAARAAQISAIKSRSVVVTSYDLLKRDIDKYEGIRFMYCALDEAQYIKNRATKAAQAVKRVDCLRRFALTGTPIENRLSEMWSIFDFLMPGYLGAYARFKEKFEMPIMKNSDTQARDDLKKLASPFILRRLKKDVLEELPPKFSAVRRVVLEGEQRRVYDSYALTAAGLIRGETPGESRNRIQILKMLTRLRQICCDPSLCLENYTAGSAKLDACVELLLEARDGGHRVLLFSQFTSMLAIIAARLDAEGLTYMTLTGDTPKGDRLEMTRRFNMGEGDVFLISLKAGGTGLNLTGADTVVHYDPWWNLAAQNQATDRAYRIGQMRSVQVYRLIAQNTIEERILDLQEKKGELAELIETGGEATISSMPAEDIIALFSVKE